MTVNPDRALRAYKLATRGMKNPDIAKKLGLPSSREVDWHRQIGSALQLIKDSALSEAELLLLTTLAQVQRDFLAEGRSASPKAKNVEWRARKGAGWFGRTIKKRLAEHGYAHHSVNGHVWLLERGWALVLAIEGRTAPIAAIADISTLREGEKP